MIISVSRRTDIPAFYTPWFMNRVRAGFLLTRNPFNAKQIKRVSLTPQNVDAFVFWTRNPTMLMNHLEELDKMGFHYYFQYTLTGYPKILEKSVPRPHRAIHTFKTLSNRIGANKVIWRYDPILLCDLVDVNEHKRLFAKIASMLSGYTEKVVISFTDLYRKTTRNLSAIRGLTYWDITRQPLIIAELLDSFSEIAQRHQLRLETCSEALDTSHWHIGHGKCIDEKFINEVFGLCVNRQKDLGQRPACGCVKSIDIGSYNTCLHECAYCYATYNQTSVLKNKGQHDPKSPFLIGGIENIDPMLLLPESEQISLFINT